MLFDRDRYSHLDNLEEIREIIRARGWVYTIGYLQVIEEQIGSDPELERALEELYEVAERVEKQEADDDDEDEDEDEPPIRQETPSRRKKRGRKRGK